jgi:hypothetical protein
MPAWPGLLIAPLLALAEQSVVYALATPTCQTQREVWLHGVPLAFLVLTLLCTLMAWGRLRRLRGECTREPQADADPGELRGYFVARLAVWSGAMSSLVIAAMWIPQWVLSPCAS